MKKKAHDRVAKVKSRLQNYLYTIFKKCVRKRAGEKYTNTTEVIVLEYGKIGKFFPFSF